MTDAQFEALVQEARGVLDNPIVARYVDSWDSAVVMLDAFVKVIAKYDDSFDSERFYREVRISPPVGE